MSERLQHTAASTREKMLQRYGDTLHHKHDKNHNPYRQHCRSHPVQKSTPSSKVDQDNHVSTGLIRAMKLRQYRNRVAKNRVH